MVTVTVNKLYLGEQFYEYCRGIDKRKVQTRVQRKSVGTQLSWGIRYHDMDHFTKFLNDVVDEVVKRMNEINVQGSKLTLMVTIYKFY